MRPPRLRSFLVAKRGSEPDECEDALAERVASGHLRLAVVDGATEGHDSRRWARTLAAAWTHARELPRDAEGLAAAARLLGDRQQARWTGRALPWYLEEKSQAGAFAAFVGVAIDARGAWEAWALGDLCLFVDGHGAPTSSFPLAASAEFSSRPLLVPSRHAGYQDFVPHVRHLRGVVAPGTRMTLLSDAISAWSLAQFESGGGGWDALHAMLDRDDRAAIAELVAAERAAHRMRNDDVAILRAEWAGDTAG